METCQSPRTVMRLAYALAHRVLPDRTSKFSRQDFTLPQLLACLVVKEQMKLSYRKAEALLRDCPDWCGQIGLPRVPDHHTLCRARRFLMRAPRVNRLRDRLVRWAARARLLRLAMHPPPTAGSPP
jgi:hypothetical protein